MTEPIDQRAQRLAKMQALRAAGIDPYPARFPRTHSAAQALEEYAAFERAQATPGSAPAADASPPSISAAGRLMAIRAMGKATFGHIMDGTGRLQVYLRQDELGEERYQFFLKNMDLGDFVGVHGSLFRTRTGEVTLRVSSFAMLAKTLQLLPEKWHGLTDIELRFRQRYLDLLVNEKSRRTFVTRTRIVSSIRRFLDDRGYLEVETPVLQPVYGGAAARPFVTHHNVLDADLYLRISDELYLKRLVIGGLDRVYEIGHDFRNEGISTQHNPEFTQIEVYLAYADYNDMMTLVEECWSYVAREVLGTARVMFQGQEIDLSPPWRRVTMRQAILDSTGVDIQAFTTPKSLRERAAELGLKVDPKPTWGKQIDELFSEYVQPSFVQPTLMIDYPIDISPLAKKKPDSPGIVERFEFFVGGMECGNAFSELNDPIDQRERFEMQDAQLHEGDDEAHPADEDWIRALEHGMPPTGGLGFGIDRMTMLLTDSPSIRDVILFPPLRAKTSGQETEQ